MTGLNENEIDYLRKAPFQKENPFSAEVLELTLKAEDFSVLAFEHGDGKVFGGDPAQLKEPDFRILDLIPEPLVNLKKRIEATPTLKEAQTLLLVLAKDEAVWAFKAEVESKEDQVHLSLEPHSKKTLEALGRDEDVAEIQSGNIVPIDVIFFRYACLKDKDTQMWVSKVATLLKKANLWPADNRPKFICLRYDTDQKSKSDFAHPFIDDLLCMPLDRLIFLQKTEIALQLPEKIKPSFLFVQEANDPVEVAKQTQIERLSDLAFSITNPVPLARGTTAHVYFNFPGQAPLIDVYGKAIRNLPHPDLEGQHFVFFSYYALDKEPFTHIRGQITKDSGYKLLINNNPKDFEYNPDNIFIEEEQKKIRTFAVIDLDEEVLTQTADNIQKEFGNCDVVRDSSYYVFFKKYLAPEVKEEDYGYATPEDLFAEMVSFLIGFEDLNFQMALTVPEDESLLLGHKAQELFSTAQGWMKLFENHDARELMTETLFSLSASRRSRRVYPLVCEDGAVKNVMVEFILESNNRVVRLNLSAADPLGAEKKKKQLESLDALIIDYSLLPKDVEAFVSGLKKAVNDRGLRTLKDGPAIIVTGSRPQQKQLMSLMNKGIHGAIQKPIETRRLLFQLSELTDSPFCIYSFDNVGWKQEKISAKLARPATMVELSEFGATLKLGSRLKVGSMFFIFGSIFRNAPGQNLCCRVYHSTEADGEPGQYLNYVVFFGITDSFLKFTRSYIRETYANKKAKEGAQ